MAVSMSSVLPAGVSKKKLGIVCGLFGLLLVVLVVRFVVPGGEASDSAQAGPSGLLDSQPEHLETIARIARLQSETIYATGDLRDPLEPLIKERTTASTEPRKTESVPASNDLPRMLLHGVFWDPESPIVIIDGLDLRVGDSIKGARVVEIGRDSVVLTYKSRRHVLTVE